MNFQHVTGHVVAIKAYLQSRILVPVGIHYYGDLMLQRLLKSKLVMFHRLGMLHFSEHSKLHS